MVISPTMTMACARLFVRFCQAKNFSPPGIQAQPLAKRWATRWERRYLQIAQEIHLNIGQTENYSVV
jgi:hypothetical protein